MIRKSIARNLLQQRILNSDNILLLNIDNILHFYFYFLTLYNCCLTYLYIVLLRLLCSLSTLMLAVTGFLFTRLIRITRPTCIIYSHHFNLLCFRFLLYHS